MSVQEHWVTEDLTSTAEFAVLQEWEYLQQRLILSMQTLAPSPTSSWRRVIDKMLAQCTRGRAFLYWEQLAVPIENQCDRFCEVRFKQIHYGWLGLTPGYLVFSHFPDILQRFAHL